MIGKIQCLICLGLLGPRRHPSVRENFEICEIGSPRYDSEGNASENVLNRSEEKGNSARHPSTPRY